MTSIVEDILKRPAAVVKSRIWLEAHVSPKSGIHLVRKLDQMGSEEGNAEDLRHENAALRRELAALKQRMSELEGAAALRRLRAELEERDAELAVLRSCCTKAGVTESARACSYY